MLCISIIGTVTALIFGGICGGIVGGYIGIAISYLNNELDRVEDNVKFYAFECFIFGALVNALIIFVFC
ncbi:hypothetical protein Phum_PHUM219560 [Pediculus humanus corporis]|uniref:Uncharacterized protein n=1 Tax=Pediculus humanus subsp. corporis TaxID=121224 RepID=E0VI17_PEDHC|nr:uncharacterized protein Phum_PHUM219560 [Pediculus humanus corporis]EEB13023.1 hypothetical protein Phum_PHUM219560 [Pediculus humanus corporis]